MENYDLQDVSGRLQFCYDGTIILKSIMHPVNKGFDLRCSLEAGVDTKSITVRPSHSQVAPQITVCQDAQEGCVIQIAIRSRGPVGVTTSSSDAIGLHLTYAIRSMYWTPQYALNIKDDGGATLALTAQLQPSSVKESSFADVSNLSANLTMHGFRNLHLGVLEEQSARRGEVVEQYMPELVSHTWTINNILSTSHRLQSMEIPSVVAPNRNPSQDAITMKLRMHDRQLWTLPAGVMEIKLLEAPIESVFIPEWNPKDPLIIELKSKEAQMAIRKHEAHLQTTSNTRIEAMATKPGRNDIQYVLNPASPVPRERGQLSGLEGNRSPSQSVQIPGNIQPLHGGQGKPSRKSSPTSLSPSRSSDIADGGHSNKAHQRPSSTSQGCHQKDLHQNIKRIDIDESFGEVRGATTAGRFVKARSKLTEKRQRSKNHSSIQPPRSNLGPSLADSKSSPTNTAISITKVWREAMVQEWDPWSNQWKTDGGNLSYIEVRVECRREPVHLSSWTQEEWMGRLCDGASLKISTPEVFRLIRSGGSGQGRLFERL